ncbi:DUF2062 domain-containing protein [Tateyamaria armeniaca]|uniref:DUF2062 domain-containing protein n=1 Tax=Tateyamaria armeniaca TaxID=2518930 RepID=A0ABW8UV46_9RHOB
MVFKRRDPKPILRSMLELVWPRGGWARAFQYVNHRVRRLPDTPEKIARGIWAGVFTAFTPFYGVHFVIAAAIATAMRGNILASLMATFFGNPLTYVPIGLVALQTGHWLLGTEMSEGTERSFSGKFVDAGGDLWQNLKHVIMGEPRDWAGLATFYDEIFFPYLVGGIIPGVIAATVCYYLSVPVIRAYQHRRKGAIKAKFESLKAKAAAKAIERKKKAD